MSGDEWCSKSLFTQERSVDSFIFTFARVDFPDEIDEFNVFMPLADLCDQMLAFDLQNMNNCTLHGEGHRTDNDEPIQL